MDLKKNIIITVLGLIVLFGFLPFPSVSSQNACTQIRNCTICGTDESGLKCLQCNDGYAQYKTGCCSKGCLTDGNSSHVCDLQTGKCLYDRCLTSFYGDYCLSCVDRIQHCDDCAELGDSTDVRCVLCATNYEKTTDSLQCCPKGCDSCGGEEGTTCTTCKSGYYLYNGQCDTCGENCLEPGDGSPRCNPANGQCYYGCKDGFHGSKCQVPCTINNCVECDYDEPNKVLTCIECEPGRYGIDCRDCSVTCSPAGFGDKCYQDGTCKTGCLPGYFGAKCDVECDTNAAMVNCEECHRYNFTCTLCKPGHWGLQCQSSCNANCVPFQGQRTCKIGTGECDAGCLAGFYKSDCSGSCPNCGQGVCDRVNGNCLARICDPGFYGQKCNSTCPVNCAPNPASNNAFCDFTSGECTYGCREGYWGSRCEFGCSMFCKLGQVETVPSCMQSNGTCNHQCVNKYYEYDCTKECISTCVDETCDIETGKCKECDKGDQAGYLCPSGTCAPGKYGQFCQADCTENCLSNCGRYNGTCFGCDPGFHGNSCEFACGWCSSGTCDQKTGLCTTPCQPGYWNVYCNQTCLHDGCNTCFQGNGECETCDNGFYGVDCSQRCSVYCERNSLDQLICAKDTSNCIEGSCLPGYWNGPCDTPCNQNCLANGNGERTCFVVNGNCDLGCEDTYYGGHCNSRCSPNCIGRLCNRDGRCSSGCVDGAYGDTCSLSCKETCNNGKCNQTSGECDECKKPYELQSELCRTAACDPVDTWGLFCENKCPENCADGTCSRSDGTCSSCKPETYGATCDKSCPNCLSNQCYQTDGYCTDGNCDNGWYNFSCMIPCKHAGCQNCHQFTGECITCKVGKFGSNCSEDCERTCAANNDGLITCNSFSGECDAEQCKAGYFGRKCDLACSKYCQNVTCDIDVGTCAPCIEGWYGQKCEGQCSPRCKNHDCEVTEDNCRQGCTDGYWGSRCEHSCSLNCERKACNQQTGACLYGCTGSNYYEPTCSEPCSTNCVDTVCNSTGYCLKECNTGWYGDKCQDLCQATARCTNGKCSRIKGTCEDCEATNPGPNCPDADCPSGLRGDTCEQPCNSTNCRFNRCERYTGACIACPFGYYGPLCQKTCPNCREGTGCDLTTGVCDSGCADGWYGPECLSKCSNVCGSCERTSGECVTCAPGRWGNQCEFLCSTNCNVTNYNGIHLVVCDKDTGACTERACAVGYWGADCKRVCSTNCLQDSNNNRICSYERGKCAVGCKPTFYGDQCDSVCSARCKNQLCTNYNNSCDLGCEDGYYGATCAGTCSTHCAGQGQCDAISGECNNGCELGYYGPRCDDLCKNTCLDGTCDEVGGCPDCNSDPAGPKCRVPFCTPGFYGPTCESACPGKYCDNNICNRTTGVCRNGCRTKYYGTYCTEVCQCDEAGTRECQQTNGECLCFIGKYGTICDLTCSSGCEGSQCERDGTCTNGCITGRYGARCDKSCTNCLNGACSATTGNCLQGCTEGWYGDQCNLQCPMQCNACNKSGVCTSCSDDFYSLPTCEKTCSLNCERRGTSGRVCNQFNGDCLSGCQRGYYSLDCSQTCGNCESCNPNDGSCSGCNAGWWGTTCKNQCSSHCARGGSADERLCRQSDGYCEFDCNTGFYGDRCDTPCVSSNCKNGCGRQLGKCTECFNSFWGENCENRCDACKDGLCNKANGYCVGDCPAGYYGNMCDKNCIAPICTDLVCDKNSGLCEDCRKSPKGPKCSDQDSEQALPSTSDDEVLTVGAIAGITVGSVCFVIIFVIVFVCCMNYKRRYDDAKTEIHLPSDVIDRLSTHRSLHSSLSTNYPVARVVGDDEKDFVLF